MIGQTGGDARGARFGAAAADFLVGGEGADVIAGGAGDDTIYADSSVTGATLDWAVTAR